MWMIAMFDLPVDTKENKRQYVQFRKKLLNEGFYMMQFSVYARYCPSEESSETNKRHIKAALPPEGEVRIAMLTDRQFTKMEVFYGKTVKKGEGKPSQLMLF